MTLSDRDDLPCWLEGIAVNLWERGNRSVLEMARTSGAEKLALIVLWGGQDTADAPGGTADIVKEARERGLTDI